jgi:hypothetical protein
VRKVVLCWRLTCHPQCVWKHAHNSCSCMCHEQAATPAANAASKQGLHQHKLSIDDSNRQIVAHSARKAGSLASIGVRMVHSKAPGWEGINTQHKDCSLCAEGGVAGQHRVRVVHLRVAQGPRLRQGTLPARQHLPDLLAEAPAEAVGGRRACQGSADSTGRAPSRLPTSCVFTRDLTGTPIRPGKAACGYMHTTRANTVLLSGQQASIRL